MTNYSYSSVLLRKKTKLAYRNVCIDLLDEEMMHVKFCLDSSIYSKVTVFRYLCSIKQCL